MGSDGRSPVDLVVWEISKLVLYAGVGFGIGLGVAQFIING